MRLARALLLKRSCLRARGRGHGDGDAGHSETLPPPSALPRASLWLTNALLLPTAALCYCSTLVAIDGVEQLHSRVAGLGSCIVASALLTTVAAALALLLWRSYAPAQRLVLAGAAAACAGTATVWTWATWGTNLWRHGAYVLIGFAFFLVVFSLVLGTVVLSWLAGRNRRWRPVAVVLVLLGVCAVVLVCHRLERGKRMWHVGMFGRSPLLSATRCPLPEPSVDWSALWPSAVVRPMTDRPCQTYPGVREARFTEEGWFSMACSSGTVLVFPSIEWSFPDQRYLDDDYLSDGMLAMTAVLPYLGEPVRVNSSVVVAQCGSARELVSRSPRNTTAVELSKTNARRSGRATASDSSSSSSSSSSSTETGAGTGKLPQMNVLLVMIDAISRRKGYELLPRMHRAIETSASRGFEAFQFFRYNSVAGWTIANLAKLWARTKSNSSMWEQIRSAGFVSSYVTEGCFWDDNVDQRGFIDYVPMGPFCMREYQPPKGEGLKRGPYAMYRRCLVGKMVSTHVLHLLDEFWGAYHDVPKFSWTYFYEGHEPTGNVIQQIDAELSDLVSGRVVDLNNTAVVVFSDHGQHGDLPYLLKTESGVLDNKLPLLYMMLPQHVLRARPDLRDNLRANEQLLLTASDLRETLTHLVWGAWPNAASLDGHHSLLTRMPDRDCREAAVGEHCACSRSP
eukprot:m51a1_g9695 hypothetical protein (681) ;mRNA; r:1365073-1367349